MKRILSFFISAVIICSSFVFYAGAEDADKTLHFNDDGKFRIMMFADSQDDENLEETTTQLMREAIAAYSPDLIIFLGDNTVARGYDNQKKAIEAVTLPARETNTPFAIVFGNHDQEFFVTKEELLEIYQSLGCLTYDADPELYGCGNCNLPILSSDGTRTAFNLWLIDSGSSGELYEDGSWGYDWVREDQLQWYKDTAAQLKEANGGEVVPAMNFQHIVIPEIYDKIHVKTSESGSMTYDYCGNSYFKIPVFSRLNGYWLEECCPPKKYDGQLDAWLETGDVIAAFHGHDHNNSYNVNIEGVDVINVPTVGCNSYSKYVTRGVGLITLDENNPEDYDYELVTLYNLALKKDSKISECEGGRSKLFYALVKVGDAIVQAFFGFCRITGIYKL